MGQRGKALAIKSDNLGAHRGGEKTPRNCPLTTTDMLWLEVLCLHVHTHTHTHRHTNPSLFAS